MDFRKKIYKFIIWFKLLIIFHLFSRGFGYKSLNGTTRSEKKQFFIYNFYAWGLAFIITSCAIIANREDTVTYIRPDIGLESCWFSRKIFLHVFFI